MRRLVALAASAVLLSGCGSIASVPQAFTAQVPTSGPIQQGAQVTGSNVDQFIRVIARPPSPGMTATQVVQGFLEASASFDGNHAVAREYLTAQASERWNSSSRVVVYEGAPALTESGPSVQVRATQVGRIATNGRYEVDAPGTEAIATFRIIETDAGLRIDGLPNGLLLSQTDVDRAFRSYALYFFNPTFEILVPDARMLPVVGPGLATTLVRRLLEGPNDWLRPAVRTGFPDGVDLNIDAVLVDGGVARVDLSSSVQLADDAARRALSQQLVWTLRQLPDVQAVDVTAAGQPFFVPGVGNPQSRDAWPEVDPAGLPLNAAAYVASTIGVRQLTDDGTIPIAGQAGTREPLLADIAVSHDASRIAGVDVDGQVWSGAIAVGSSLFEFDELPSPVSLAYDGDVNVWAVDDAGTLALYSPSGRAFAIDVTGLSEADVLTAAVPSRDGTRAALLVVSGQRSYVLLARVVRASATARVGISVQEPIRVESRLVEAVDVAWSSADSLAVLGSESAGSLQVFEINVGRGSLTAQGAPEGPLSVAAAPGLPTLVSAADGVVYDNTTGTWSGRVNATSPTYPG
ncbi:MAG: LpqB family beta-propeller domain-containing protein [Actinomycetota bacterium]|nr:LpqB family beta-propeller domain-containing protein [Actinomycetota bacterium]